MPALPASSEAFGVLPRVIKTLVVRRQEVKRLLKSEANPLLRQEYDIRQQVYIGPLLIEIMSNFVSPGPETCC